MVNPFPYSLDNKRYHTLYYHLRTRFPHRVGKAAVDAGFFLPESRRHARGAAACTYCRSGGTEFTESASLPVREQLERELSRICRKWPDAGAIAYSSPTPTPTRPFPVCALFSPKRLPFPESVV